MPTCSICGKHYEGYGNNAQPVMTEDVAIIVMQQ